MKNRENHLFFSTSDVEQENDEYVNQENIQNSQLINMILSYDDNLNNKKWRKGSYSSRK